LFFFSKRERSESKRGIKSLEEKRERERSGRGWWRVVESEEETRAKREKEKFGS